MTGGDRIDRENQWVRQMHNNNAAGFEQMYRHYFPRLCQFILRYIHSKSIARDLIQDVFHSVWENRRNLKPNGKLRAYLYTAARNQALKYLRDEEGLNHTDVEDFSLLKSSAITPEEQLTYDEFEQKVLEAIQQLPERRRQVFLMHREDNLTYRETAEVLGLSIKTVETHMSRSLKFLRTNLAEYLSVTAFIVGLIFQFLL